MKTSEMIAMYEASKCPEKLKFASDKGGSIEMRNGILVWTDSGKPFILNLFGYKLDCPSCTTAGTINKYNWTLVCEPVHVWEAIKAYCEGKKVYCVFNMFGDKEGKFYLNNSNDWAFRGNLLTEGKWFIEDTPNA